MQSIHVELQTAEWDCGVQCYRAALASRGIDCSHEQAVGELCATKQDGTSDYALVRALGNRDMHALSYGFDAWLSANPSREPLQMSLLCVEDGAHWILALARVGSDVIIAFDPEVGLGVYSLAQLRKECVCILSGF